MATSSEGGERRSLTQFAKQKSKYGSISKNVQRKDKLIQHTVQPNDTLQGLALRYGVTMEDIKRTNKLWTTDSLFLRTHLSIPVPNDFFDSTSSNSESPLTSPTKTLQTKRSHSASIVQNSHLSPNGLQFDISNNSLEGEREESMEDFLIRIDSSIAQTRDKVKQLDHAISDHEEIDHQPVAWRYPPSSRHFKENGYHGPFTDISDPCITPQTVVMTQGRKVVSSLKRLEREQDEIFEL